jgi:hypothetical protein
MEEGGVTALLQIAVSIIKLFGQKLIMPITRHALAKK